VIAMTTPLSLMTATAADFRPLTSQPFSVTLPTGEKVQATLAEVNEQARPSADRRTSFSLIFHVSLDPVTTSRPLQGTLTFDHPATGALEVFAVALRPAGNIARWQVVFG
jgi:hypothetical protein